MYTFIITGPGSRKGDMDSKIRLCAAMPGHNLEYLGDNEAL